MYKSVAFEKILYMMAVVYPISFVSVPLWANLKILPEKPIGQSLFKVSVIAVSLFFSCVSLLNYKIVNDTSSN